jgi:hypothetical protein
MKAIVKNLAGNRWFSVNLHSSLFAQKSGDYKSYADFMAGKMEYGMIVKESHK